eukprot:3392801-Pyramimonas_sp.AAC.1
MARRAPPGAAPPTGRGGKGGRGGGGRGDAGGRGGRGRNGQVQQQQISDVIVADTVNAEHNSMIEAKWRTCLTHDVLSDLPGCEPLPPSEGGNQATWANRDDDEPQNCIGPIVRTPNSLESIIRAQQFHRNNIKI